MYPHGSTDSLPYCTMGSGSLNAMAVFEDGFKEDMDVEDAKKLVARAIKSGIYNDLGSGSNVDLCIIYKDKVRGRICKCPTGSMLTNYGALFGKQLLFGADQTDYTACVLRECKRLRVSLLQVEYLRNYEYLMDTTFKRAYPVEYAPGTTGKSPCLCVQHQSWLWGKCKPRWHCLLDMTCVVCASCPCLEGGGGWARGWMLRGMRLRGRAVLTWGGAVQRW